MSESGQPKAKLSHVQSVARALTLLDIMAEVKRDISVTELSKRLGWPKSTIHGLLSTLRDYHYLTQSSATGLYRLGVRFFEIGNVVASLWDVRAVALPHMRAINAQLGEMLQLATEEDGEVLYLEKVDSTQMIRIVSEVGGRQPMHCTGLGKALLAYKSYAEVRSILSTKGMPRFTKRTITTVPEMEQELAKIRKQGYAMDDREVMDGLRCVAVPIFDKDSNARYAVSVSGLYNNMLGDKLNQTVAMLKQAAEEISYAIGFRRKE
ncbi:MAG: IclR family transcriptional regulator [Oscillospiraceae bacterium]|jgi:DNA-binding IclR family transcriptional regulator|nr:IclR family transcriptional regulator [Oscillospiraceae bacterium]